MNKTQHEITLPSKNVIITSLPKSGTHLALEFVKELGFRATGIHICPNAKANEGFFQGKTQFLSTSEFLTNLQNKSGTVTAGHMPSTFSDQTDAEMVPVIFMVRNPRSVAISSMRFISKVARKNPEMNKRWPWVAFPDSSEKLCDYLDTAFRGVLNIWHQVRDWRDAPHCLTIHYEALAGDLGNEPQLNSFEKMAQHVGQPLDQVNETFNKVLFKKGGTWTGQRSIVDQVWSDRAEQLFLENGGEILLKEIGAH